MTVADLVELIREQTNLSSDQLSDAKLLKYINIAYHDLENTIVSYVAEDFFYEIFKADLVSGQSEYTFEKSTSTQEGMDKVTQLSVKWDGDAEYYTKLTNLDSTNSIKSRDYLRASQPQLDGMYEIKDSSFFVYPEPDETIVDGIKVGSIVNLIDLTLTDTEDEIFPCNSDLRQYIPHIATGAKQWIYGLRGMINEKNDALNEWELEKVRIIKETSDRFISPTIGITDPKAFTLAY